MAEIVSRRAVATELKAFREGFTALMVEAARSIAGEVVAAAGSDGIIQPREAARITERAGRIIRAVFVDGEGRAVLPDGTPVSPYATLLLTACARVTVAQIKIHQAWMKANVPKDVQRRLKRQRRSAREFAGPVKRGRRIRLAGEALEFEDDPDRIFQQNPLAQYDPAHTWVDPNGYTLSERIWRADSETRARLNALLRDEIQAGTGALVLSRRLEQFIVPGREALKRTSKPYGTDASYHAMRLARTEIAHAGNSAALAAATMNPFVNHIEVRRSGNGDPKCPVCPQYVGKHKVESAPRPPFHPHCMCHVASVPTMKSADVAKRLRDMLQSGKFAGTTPLNADELATQLLGTPIAKLAKVKQQFKRWDEATMGAVRNRTMTIEKERANDVLAHKWRDEQLTPEQRNALMRYTGSSYTPINEWLRRGIEPYNKEEIQTIIDDLQSIYKRKDGVWVDDVTFRGLGWQNIDGFNAFMAKHQVGAELATDSFWSTATTTEAAWLHKQHTVMLEIYGKSKLHIGTASSNPGEQEVLINLGMKYKVLDVKKVMITKDGGTREQLTVIIEEILD